MVCDILDLRCIFVNELVGSVALTMILSVITYFMIAAKGKWGFDTTITLAVPIVLILGLVFTSFSIIFAFATMIIAMIFAALYNKLIGN